MLDSLAAGDTFEEVLVALVRAGTSGVLGKASSTQLDPAERAISTS